MVVLARHFSPDVFTTEIKDDSGDEDSKTYSLEKD